MFLLTGLLALPLSASAQDGEEGTISEPNLQEPAPSAEPAPEQPALEIQLDPSGVDVVPSAERYTLQYSAHLLETVPVGRALTARRQVGSVRFASPGGF